MYNLTFDHHGVSRHGLTYTTLFRTCMKENLYLLNALQQKKFNVDLMIKEEMKRLETNAK
jgi:hypothetical protein